ncbi:MAG TPA: acetyl-CoA carboxylase biotin carboxyl carrier protein [Sulfuricurvum sp.]|nr:acetyl-CoA carboxylase biotin carboxyl carrier protein [Sulfuricurvum sp.]
MDMRQIKALLQEFDESGLSRLKISKEGFEIELEKAVTAVAPASTVTAAASPTPAAAPAPTTAPAAVPHGDEILSPMVGTFYSAPSPDSAPFVKVGDTVKKGQVIAILEAMKIMNELEAEFDCRILDILVSDGQAVEYDMPLFVIEKL